MIVALVATRAGFPLAYEVMEGNRSDRTTLRDFLDQMEKPYGQARRVWVMDRGIPTEAVLQEMRNREREVYYLVGTPRSQVQPYEKKWLELPWKKVREPVEGKRFADHGEWYVLAKSEGRQAQERVMRRKRPARWVVETARDAQEPAAAGPATIAHGSCQEGSRAWVWICRTACTEGRGTGHPRGLPLPGQPREAEEG